MTGWALLSWGVLYIHLKRVNAARDALTAEERRSIIDAGKDGDEHPDFRFLF